MKRVVIPELLDEDIGTPQEIQDSLLDLRGFNRRAGGFSSIGDMLRRIATEIDARRLSFLDVAGGTGDLARSVTEDLAEEGIEIRPAVLDRAISHMNGSDDKLPRVGGDALALPFIPTGFDVVGCNLFCHHLESEEMIQFFNEGLRVARVAVIVSDLRRNAFHLLAAYSGRIIYRSPITVHDAPVSVRRAYTMAEIAAIAKRTNAARFELRPYYFQRFGLTLWKARP
jgi:ubiquinone/menaquinone biosynthesis C-methylase UbiE